MALRILDELIATRFAKLAGMNISGTVPLDESLVNDALRELVQTWSGPPKTQSSSVPVAEVLSLVKKLQVRAEQGRINVDFEIGV